MKVYVAEFEDYTIAGEAMSNEMEKVQNFFPLVLRSTNEEE